jgi:hypothetical protein
MSLTEQQKKDISDLIEQKGGPISTIEHLLSTDLNKDKVELMIRYILTIRYVSKKTYLGDETITEYLERNGIYIDFEK